MSYLQRIFRILTLAPGILYIYMYVYVIEQHQLQGKSIYSIICHRQHVFIHPGNQIRGIEQTEELEFRILPNM